jgi:integrase
MKHPFTLERGGRTYYLVKHPSARKLPPAELARKPWFLRYVDPKTKRETWNKVGEYYELQIAVEAAKKLIELSRGEAHPFIQYRDQVTYRQRLTLGRMLADYQAAGCPDDKGRPRQGTALETLKTHIKSLIRYEAWAERHPSTITDADRAAYHGHRTQTVKAGVKGDRTTELEAVTLNSALRWAWRRGDLQELPREMNTTFRAAADIEHARDVMPSSAEELHAIARHFFSEGGDSVVYGWATLLGAYTALRRGELQMLRAHPQRHGVHVEPGWYDERLLIVPRTKRRAGNSVQGEFLLNDPTRPDVKLLLDRIRAWRATYQPTAPQRGYASDHIDQGALLPMAPDTLTKHLQRAAKDLGLPQRQAHGLRAYYVSARLAAGISPAQVADEVGHLGSGDALVRTIYGATPPQWRGLENVYTWLPTGENRRPAWTQLEPAANLIAI